MVLVYLKKLLLPSNASQHRYVPLDVDLENSPACHKAPSPERHDENGSDSSSDHHMDQSNDPTSTSAYSTHRRSIDPRTVSDATIGLSDGLTVPFALTAGLSALGSSRVVIFGGLAELTAGAISMGLGGWLAARGEAEAYAATVKRTQSLVHDNPARATALARSTLAPYLSSPPSEINLSTDPTVLTRFLLHFHHNTPSPSSTRSALASALTIASGYFFGGLIPLFPYFYIPDVGHAFKWSAIVMAIALFVFGWGKTYLNTSRQDEEGDLEKIGTSSRRKRLRWHCIWAGVQMVVLGGIAACAAMGLVKAFNSAGEEPGWDDR